MEWHKFVIRYATLIAILVLAIRFAPSWLQPSLLAFSLIVIIAPFFNPYRIWRRLAALCVATLVVPHTGAKLGFDFSFLQLNEGSDTKAAVSFIWDSAISNVYVVFLLFVVCVIADLIQNFPDVINIFNQKVLTVSSIDSRTKVIEGDGEVEILVLCRIENKSSRKMYFDEATLRSLYEVSTDNRPNVEISTGVYLNMEDPLLPEDSKLYRLKFNGLSLPFWQIAKKIPDLFRKFLGLDVWSGTVVLKISNQERKIRVNGKFN